MLKPGFAVLVLNIACATLVSGQDRSRGYMEVTLGANFLLKDGPYDGVYYDRGAPTAILAFGTQPDTSRSFVGAILVGLLNAIPSASDVCRFTPEVPLGGCYQDHPLSGIVAVTAGGRPLTGPWRFLELTVGPAYIGGSSAGAIAIARTGHAPGHYVSVGLSFLGVLTMIDGHPALTGGVGFSLRTW
jgi:hypothetical protein